MGHECHAQADSGDSVSVCVCVGGGGGGGGGKRVETKTSGPICEFQRDCSMLPTIILSCLTFSGSGKSQQTTTQDTFAFYLFCLGNLTYRILFSEKKKKKIF